MTELHILCSIDDLLWLLCRHRSGGCAGRTGSVAGLWRDLSCWLLPASKDASRCIVFFTSRGRDRQCREQRPCTPAVEAAAVLGAR